MRIATLAGVIATASVGQAFLIPPSTSSPVGNQGHYIGLGCPGCPVPLTDSKGEFESISTTTQNILLLQFYVQSKPSGDALMLKDVQLYPVVPQSRAPLRVTQLAKTKLGGYNRWTGSPVLSYMLSWENQAPQKGQESLGLVKVHFEVLQVGGKDVRIPSLDLNLLTTPSGKLMIGDIKQTTVDSGKDESSKQCTTVICRWVAMVSNKFKGKKMGCGKSKHSDPRPNVQVDTPGTEKASTMVPSMTRPFPRPHPQHHKGPHGPQGHHGAGRHHGGFARVMRSIVFHVLVPIFLGVAMGVSASLVGMIVGHLAIFVWRRVFRRNQGTEYHKVQQVEAAAEKEATDGLLANQSAPPVYEEAPAYVEAVVDEKL